MGCDGGTIPKRDELVRTKKKKAQVTNKICNIFHDILCMLIGFLKKIGFKRGEKRCEMEQLSSESKLTAKTHSL